MQITATDSQFLTRAEIAAGAGTLEEKLLGLMRWVGTTFLSGEKHSGLLDPLAIMRGGTAWCDQQSIVWSFLAYCLFDVVSRKVTMWHVDGANGHTVAEAFYDNAWHLFDPSTDHLTVYRDPADNHIMAWRELHDHPAVVEAENHWWRGTNGVGKVGFFAHAPLYTSYDFMRSLLSSAEYDAIVPALSDAYGPAFFKAAELDHGWSNKLFGHVLYSVFRPNSVIDFGCGTGGTLAALRRCGLETVVGVDGYPACYPFITRNDSAISIMFHDLTAPLWLHGTYDLAISIEVLEHVAESGADAAVASICRAAPVCVVTACPPQSVKNALHLNEQPFGYWMARFAANGRRLNVSKTSAIRNIMRAFAEIPGYATVPGWFYSENLGVFE